MKAKLLIFKVYILSSILSMNLLWAAKPPHPKGGPPGQGGGTTGPGTALQTPIDNYLWLLIAAAIIVIMWVYYKKLKPQKI